jgi:hypothetical protein
MAMSGEALQPVVVGCNDFLAFHEDLLMTKFGPGLDEVHTHLNFVVQLLNVIYCVCVEIGEAANMDAAKPFTAAMANTINNFTRFFPRCVDYDFLKAFCKSAREKIPKLVESHLSLQELAVLNPELNTHLPNIVRLFSVLPDSIRQLEVANENASILTKKIAVLKQEVSKPLLSVLEGVRAFSARKTEAANHVELQQTIETCLGKYQKLVSDPPLKKATQIQHNMQQTVSAACPKKNPVHSYSCCTALHRWEPSTP